MIALKTEYKVQVKTSNQWKITHWDQGKSTLAACKIGIIQAELTYPELKYRIIKIHRRYEVVKS